VPINPPCRDPHSAMKLLSITANTFDHILSLGPPNFLACCALGLVDDVVEMLFSVVSRIATMKLKSMAKPLFYLQ
jgi:hypothetical protein